MGNTLSMIDKKNCQWFMENASVKSLRSISLREGHIRGLHPFDIEFTYPISVIAGKNGSGKSTLLALAACAYHNSETGYKHLQRNQTYYTFSDFFIQTKQEHPPEGIKIVYGIFYDKWKGKQGESLVNYQIRRKPQNGRWNNYEKRLNRDTVFLGTLRVASSNEISAHKSYSRRFTPCSIDDKIAKDVCAIAAKVFDKEYKYYREYQHGKFNIPSVDTSDYSYSSFNMGSGEKSVFSILQAIFACGKGTLFVIDEIELGLHPSAQKNLIFELKNLCYELQCQIICTTHSSTILDSLPLDARFYIENGIDATKLYKGISSEYAHGKLSDTNSEELTIFVEDKVSYNIVCSTLSHEIRARVCVVVIGSDLAIVSQVVSRFREGRTNCMAILDGDKTNERKSLAKRIQKAFSSNVPNGIDIENDIVPKFFYLPGDRWPEFDLIDHLRSNTTASEEVAKRLVIEVSDLHKFLDNSVIQGSHKELHYLSNKLHIPQDQVISEFVKAINLSEVAVYQCIEEDVRHTLSDIDGST